MACCDCAWYPVPSARWRRLPTSLDDGVSCKGAWLPADGSGSASRPKGDLKLVLDLESTELASTPRAASLFPTLSGAALPALDALDAARHRYISLVHAALARVILDASIRDEAEATVLKYRLCDYPAHAPLPGASTRCSEHTDYGTATLIFEDGQPGLEVWQDEEWRSVPPGARGDALLIFGWCSYQKAATRAEARGCNPKPCVLEAAALCTQVLVRSLQRPRARAQAPCHGAAAQGGSATARGDGGATITRYGAATYEGAR